MWLGFFYVSVAPLLSSVYYGRQRRMSAAIEPSEDAGEDHMRLRVEYFDNAEDAEVHTVVFLHLLAVMADSTGKHAFANPVKHWSA